jgi:hypothetical protein
MEIYCGNNAKHPDLEDGSRRIGTRSECFRKGLKNGLALPVDELFTKPYEPINKEKKYCGDDEKMPYGFDRPGGLHECYLKGVGTGKRKKAMRPRKSVRKSRRKTTSNSRRKTVRKSRRKSKRKSRK